MKTIVLGAGGVGTATAYYLAKNGMETVVVDRQPDVALETSFANAGQISPGYASPWAAPGVPLKALKWMFETHAPLIIRPVPDLTLWLWLARMLANCTERRYEINKGRMLRIANYSRECLIQLRADTGIEYDHRERGLLQLFRYDKQLEAARRDAQILARYDVPHQLLDRAGCIEHEPGLKHVADKIVGGLRLPNDETGDCRLFTQTLAEKTRQMGVEYRLDTRIDGINVKDGRVREIRTDKGPLKADQYVLALGSYSPFLLAPIGIKLPIFPVKGYSATLPVTDDEAAPVSTLMDEAHKVAITRLGDRIRAAGMAELAGYDLKLRRSRCETIAYVVRDLFPKGGNVEMAEYWTGLRPMTPDGTPVLGASRYPNLWLNTGHGTLGWTMAAGSGKVVADLVAGKRPEIDMDGMTAARYG